MIILPHLLEFDAYRFQTMREIERILKPEGHLVILNFNPWSVWVRYQSLWDLRLADSWRGHFISRSRVIDWLKLLNFEITMSSLFHLDSISSCHGKFVDNTFSLTATTYAIKAIKRRYSIIPLTPVKDLTPRLAVANNTLAKLPHAGNE
jgi:SAM-dependent methyltransferase